MPDTDFIIAPQMSTISIALEPAFNAVGSLRLLTWVQEGKHDYGADAWVTRTLAAMTPEQQHNHRVVMLGLYYVVDPVESYTSFPAYINHLAAQPGEALRDKLLNAYLEMATMKCQDPVLLDNLPDKAHLLASKENYVGFLDKAFGDALFDREIEAEAYDLIMDPPRMVDRIVSYLREMWDVYLAEEWLRARPMLQEAVDAFRQVDVSGMSKQEAARYVTGQDLHEKFEAYLDRFERVVFMPSPHLGASQGHFNNDTTAWIMFGARLPEGSTHRSKSPLTRADLLVRLNALADDTRLRILGLIAEEGELCAQDIIMQLDVSQSAASRHLKQLSATGYLVERRRENAKCYSLNESRLTGTLDAVKQYLNLM